MHPVIQPPIAADDLQRSFESLPEHVWRGLQGRRIFITGGTGFVGKWLLSTLIDVNRRLQLDVRATVLSRDPESFRTAMPSLADAAELHWVRGDVREFEGPEQTHDTIIHAATDVVAQSTPELTFDTCIDGTRHVLDFAAATGAKDFLLVSSGAVYGRQPSDLLCVPETYHGAPDSLSPGSAYGEGKRASEWLCAAAAARSGLRVVTARCFAFVGPHLPLDKHFAIGNFLDMAMAGEEIVIHGDGTPIRSYLYAADMAAWLWSVLLLGRQGVAYNVGAEDALSIANLAQRVCQVLNTSLPIRIHSTATPGRAPDRYVPSHSRARDELGLPAPLPLDEAIRRTVRWHRNLGTESL